MICGFPKVPKQAEKISRLLQNAIFVEFINLFVIVTLFFEMVGFILPLVPYQSSFSLGC